MPRLFLLSDPHLGTDMSRFNCRWDDHVTRLGANWDRTVGPEDVVLVPGDVSWARKPRLAVPDLEWLDARPGAIKVLTPGNHDHWWDKPAKLEPHLPPSIRTVDRTVFRWRLGDNTSLLFGGTKAFIAPTDPWFREDKEKAYRRNLGRVEDALAAIVAAQREEPADIVVLLLHYPPFTSHGQRTAFADRVEAAGIIDWCVFGHLHSSAEWAVCPQGLHGGVRYQLGSADYLGMQPIELLRVP